MSLIDEFLTTEERWQINENFKLARQFLHEYLDEPESFEGFGGGNSIVLLPSGDPGDVELTHANLQMAHQLAQSGREVITYEVGTRPTRRPVHLTSMRVRS